MHPYRGILRMEKWSDGLSTIPGDPNTLTRQSSGTNDAPRDLLHGLVTWNTSRHGPYYVYTYVYVYSNTWNHDCWKQQMIWRYVNRLSIAASYPPPQAPSSALAVSHNSTVPTRFDSSFSTGFDSDFIDLIQLRGFDNIWLRLYRLDSTQGFLLDLTQFSWPNLNHSFWRDLTGFDSGFSRFDSIWFDSIWITFNAIIFYLSHIIQVKFQSGFRESHIVQGVFKIIKLWNLGIFHNSDNSNCFWQEHSKNSKNWRGNLIQLQPSEKGWFIDWDYPRIVSKKETNISQWGNPLQNFSLISVEEPLFKFWF